MARTRDSARKDGRQAGTPVDSGIPSTAQKAKTTKHLHKADTVAVVEAEQPAPAKKSKSSVSNPKRQREVDDPPIIESNVTAKKARTAKEPKLLEPQPHTRRSDRAQTTTQAAPQKRKRRTKAEIAADKAKADAERKRQEELTQDNRRAMIQMDIDEDIDREETGARTIRTLASIENDSGEEFVGYADVQDTSESDSEAVNALTLKETNKALREQIKALKAQVDGGKKKGMGGKKTVTFASGLRPDWNTMIKEPVKKQTRVEISAGGLEDSDAEAVNPFPESRTHTGTLAEEELTKGAQKATRDSSRRNELVSIVSSDKEEDYIPHPAVKKVAAKIPHPVRVKATKRNEVSVPVKIEKPTNDSLPAKTAKAKRKRLNGNNVRMSDLPEFAEGKWRSTFLPTLYDKFFASDQPFDAFYKGSDQFVALLQAIIEEVYPDVEYKVTATDSIHFLAYNRINERRSSIGSNAISIVKQHIGTLNGEQAAKDWLRWSRRVDGPLFFKTPSPIDSPNDQKDPGYQFPGGRLLSPFIIGLATPLLGLRAGSASYNGHPKGLIALIMAALERAVKHFSKPLDKVKDFSKEFWGSKVRTYYDGFHGKNGIADSRWRELVEACSGHAENSEDDETCDADLSILDNNRAFVFDFCSPEKPRA
ncbi:hypothetical protein M413DRAFT_29440 [Hebeloma cylindrosporum]|uniref:Uncharacterized protein n=1 Tax=Hebeloma cylindrosporum TaxID=76867 RepID=A0A0C3C6Q5_HEBCY|nr:hypothetical protein M413DRAFT_29438 [Hebeloma cylindrosporum h7]KIM39263.1 hypothetical protein M413DRAFT_29440 [Hebeloma cylindrosporum h7]